MSGELQCDLCHGYGWVTVEEAPRQRDRGPPLDERPRQPRADGRGTSWAPAAPDARYACGRCQGIGNVGAPLPPRPLSQKHHDILHRERKRKARAALRG